MTDKAPEVTSILKFISAEIIDSSGSVYKLNNEEFISFESFYKRHSITIQGEIVIAEKADLSSVVDLKTSVLKIYIVDLYDKFLFRTFKIINVQESYNNRKQKVFLLKLRDEISYFLDNLYISKSFTGSRVQAFNEIMSTYKLNDLLTATKLKYEFEDDGITGNLVLNKNLSVLDFFEKEFKRIGFSMYQNKLGLHIKNKDNLLPSKLEVIPDIFSQIATNQLYKNRIYELSTIPAQKEELDKTPKQQSYYYDIKNKQMISINDNIDTIAGDIALNKVSSDIQETVGFKAKFQNRMDALEQKNDIRERFLHLSKSKIIVNGYINNDINKIIEMEFLGNKASAITQIEGNVVSSGKYIILSVIDKIIGDKMLQLLEVGRSDSSI